MLKMLVPLALCAGMAGCIVAPPYAYAPAPAYGYTYAPAYAVYPSVDVGVRYRSGGRHGW